MTVPPRAPAAVSALDPRQAVAAGPAIDAATEAALADQAARVVAAVLATTPGTPAHDQACRDVRTMGDDDLRALAAAAERVGALTARALDGPALAPAGVLTAAVEALHAALAPAAPSRRRLFGLLPARRGPSTPAARLGSVADDVAAALASLRAARDVLARDAVALRLDQERHAGTTGRIARFARLAALVDAGLHDAPTSPATSVQNPMTDTALMTDPTAGPASLDEAQSAARHRHAELVTALAVAVQGDLALDQLVRTDDALDAAADRAIRTASAALDAATAAGGLGTAAREAAEAQTALTSAFEALAGIEALHADARTAVSATGRVLTTTAPLGS
ncbi:toxic anion resistance protein TelA [Sediminihabitans luteus]|uniref:Toxic anion resistance protein TelA n=1 Tax=Sediminihabitans luteus TaxID=1138585 RepID=A0A2M9CY60_9CELL|nr:toxic anion resistance protein [Sediminihabitans luteus]PJJ76859.1 toxic anion resistance protein TelA [Sediminihabitans luteus]GIJ00339.1 hypothetical protein Slu03_27160 [Sediminihabitans luteus]